MNSMIRQTNIKSEDLHDYLCSYDSKNTTAVSIWAKNACGEFKPGYLVFVIEPVASPFGLISFVHKEEEDHFRVTDLAVVVRLESGKAMAVNITNTAYELRFIEVLLEEKARKAVIDRKKFSYVLARPTVSLTSSVAKELERLANAYANGGMRRNFMDENTNVLDEPVMALLTACGVHMQNSGGHKQPLDIGSVCQSLFGSGNKHPDNNRTQLKSTFIPVQGTDVPELKSNHKPNEIADTKLTGNLSDQIKNNMAQYVAEKTQSQEASGGFDLLQSWGTSQKPDAFTSGVSLFTKLANGAISDGKSIEPVPGALSSSVAETRSSEVDKSEQFKELQKDSKNTELPVRQIENLNKQTEAVKIITGAEDPLQHISEAITNLLASPQQSKPEEIVKNSQAEPNVFKAEENKQTAAMLPDKQPDKQEDRRWPAIRSFEKLPAFTNPLTPSDGRKRVVNLPALGSEPAVKTEANALPNKSSAPASDIADNIVSVTEESENKETPKFEPVQLAQQIVEQESANIVAEQQRQIDSSETFIDASEGTVEPRSKIADNTSDIIAEANIPAQSESTIALDLVSGFTEEVNNQISALDAGDIFKNSDDSEISTGQQSAIFAAVESIPDKLDDFQEPKVVMNEMASLMSKLDSQVARAAKKLAVKATEIEHKLTNNLDSLLQIVIQEDKDSSAELVIRGDFLAKEFETLFDTLKTELAENGANCREKVKTSLTTNQEQIEQTENNLRHNLIEEFEQNQIEFENLVNAQEKELNGFVRREVEILQARLEIIDQLIESSSAKLGKKLASIFDSFKKRLDGKVMTLKDGFDHRIETLNKDVKFSLAENIDKLKTSKENFFGSLERLVKITEIALSRQIRTAQTEFFIPRLKERKQIIEAMMQEMIQTFAEQSFSQAKAQSEGAENSLILARQQLKELVEGRLSKLDIAGRNQQSGLEEIFESAANPLEQKTAAVLQLIKQTEQEINECEAICNKLAEAYNLDSDPKLTLLRQDVYNKVDSLKAKLKSELESILDNNCLKLEDTIKNENAKLSTKRIALVQQVRQSSDKGLQNIREAIHDTYNSVQSQREKYME